MLEQDYHVHCSNSPDCSEPLSEICGKAREKGMREIMVTDHYEMFTDESQRAAYRPEYLDKCLYDVEECQEMFRKDLYVGFGIELGQWHLQPGAAQRIVKEYPFDYVIASYHKIGDTDLKYFHYKDIDRKEICRRYLEGLLKIAQTGDFDCLGHLDLIKRYAGSQGVAIHAEEEEELVWEILKVLVQRGKGLELNTSGLRQSVKDTFPSLTILKWYHQAGGRILTVGSDSHIKEDVAAGFREAERIAAAAGFSEITCFRKREHVQKKLE